MVKRIFKILPVPDGVPDQQKVGEDNNIGKGENTTWRRDKLIVHG